MRSADRGRLCHFGWGGWAGERGLMVEGRPWMQGGGRRGGARRGE